MLAMLLACESKTAAPDKDQQKTSFTLHDLPGGEGSVAYKPFASFMQPMANLPQQQRADFHAGKALANQAWVKAPTITTARDGLGPIYNARTCMACHIKGGRGRMPVNGDEPLFSAFVRISLPGTDAVNGVLADPVYGDQIQGQSVALLHQLRNVTMKKSSGTEREAPAEAYVYVDWQAREFRYPDGETLELRYPKLRFENLGYGELDKQLLLSLRNSPAIPGVGLLELIPQEAISVLADPDDNNGDGISGRVNQVWDYQQKKTVPGRFGWKANRANLTIVAAAAFAGDVGITNPLFASQPCSTRQASCNAMPNGNGEEGVELPQHLLDLVGNFTRNLAVPKTRQASSAKHRQDIAAGAALFQRAQCAACHVPSFVTATSADFPHLSEQRIWPFSDLLLHDMGPELADGRPDYQASGSEWRTPPLWGVGLSAAVSGSRDLLHDGRARGIEEAILWHGGEAAHARQQFINLEKTQRQQLLRFVEAL